MPRSPIKGSSLPPCSDLYFLDAEGIYRFIDADNFLSPYYTKTELMNRHYKDALKAKDLYTVGPIFENALDKGRSGGWIVPEENTALVVAVNPYFGAGRSVLGVILTVTRISAITTQKLSALGVSLASPSFEDDEGQLSG